MWLLNNIHWKNAFNFDFKNSFLLPFNTLKENKQIFLNKLIGSSNEANFLSKEERYKI
jgi:hypothetical protein